MTAAEIGPAVTREEAEELAEGLRSHLEAAAEFLARIFAVRAWEALGYESWPAMWADRYSGMAFRVDKVERLELVGTMRAEGLTQQQVADTLGVTRETVKRDVKGTNVPLTDVTVANSRGQERPATYRPRAASPSTAPVVETEPEQEEPEPEGGSVCFPDPSDGANQMKDLVRGFNKRLAPWYYSPTTKSLDTLDAWLARQQKKSEQARRKIT